MQENDFLYGCLRGVQVDPSAVYLVMSFKARVHTMQIGERSHGMEILPMQSPFSAAGQTQMSIMMLHPTFFKDQITK